MYKIIDKIANKSNQAPGDYRDKDGILRCGKCHEKKECVLQFRGQDKVFPVICQCVKLKEQEYEQLKKKEAHQETLRKLYAMGLTDTAYVENTFEKDDKRNEKVTHLCKKYVEHFDKLKKNCYGMLFYGDTGGGKSFYACCVANALLNKGVKVLVSRLSDLVRNRTESNSVINLAQFELIVLDDIGTENNSQTAYNIVDDIYRYKIPLIVTTNLAPSELKKPDTIEKRRLYDRVIERCCIPVMVEVKVSRLDIARKHREDAYKILRS